MTTSLINQAGRLIHLDQRALGEKAAALGLRFGLTQAEAEIFAREMQSLQAEMYMIIQDTVHELRCLGVSRSVINGVSATVLKATTHAAMMMAQTAADLASLESSGTDPIVVLH